MIDDMQFAQTDPRANRNQESPDKNLTNTTKTNYNMELPTPSSTSKLEKVQPIDHSEINFSPAPEPAVVQAPPSTQPPASNARAGRYQVASESEQEEVE